MAHPFNMVLRQGKPIKILLFILVFSFTSCSKNQNNDAEQVSDLSDNSQETNVFDAKTIIDSMHVGFNLGNTFDRSASRPAGRRRRAPAA